MNGYLKQSTAGQVRTIGAFIDDTDFKTLENALTINNTDIVISINGAADTVKNSGGATAHGAGGIYTLTWDATDTASIGELSFSVKVAGALVVFGTYVVLDEAVYDALFGTVALATATNITAGTITTTTNLTNLPAITANWLTAAGTAADFTTEIQTGLATAAALATAQTDLDAIEAAVITNAAGVDIAADIIAVKADTAAILVDTGTTLDGRIPAALTAGGNMKADVLAISDSTAAADALEESTEVIGTLTCAAGGTTTSVIASAIAPTSAVNDQYNGRVMVFKGNVTAALAGQATTISDYVHATLTFTVVALTTAPASGDLAVIL